MVKSLPVLMAFASGALLGLLAGVAIGPADDGLGAVEAERDRALRQVADARDRIRSLEDGSRAAPARTRVGASAGSGRDAATGARGLADPVSVGAGSADPEPPSVELSVAERESRIRELRAKFPLWLDRGDGAASVAALRELAALVPEGRVAAMELALLINADVNGDGRLRLSDVQFYGGLGDPAVKSLMDWALVRPETPAQFRVMAAWSLPWVQEPAATIAQFAGALERETETSVQSALVANLGRLKSADAERLLGAIFADPGRDAALRAQVAGELAATTDPGLVRALEIAAESDPAPSVRDAARAALVARDPPASGYLVTGTLPDSQAAAAGLRAGDVLVSYDGRETRTAEALRAATGAASAEANETVTVVVVRAGERVSLQLRPGRLGVFGRAVEASPK